MLAAGFPSLDQSLGATGPESTVPQPYLMGPLAVWLGAASLCDGLGRAMTKPS